MTGTPYHNPTSPSPPFHGRATPEFMLGKPHARRYALRMATVDVSDVVERAHRRWPTVTWSAAAFEAHLAGEAPSYPEDLYLGGAAGHRDDDAWVVISEEIGPEARRVLKRQPTADFTIEDLWAEAQMKTMVDDDKADPLPDGRQPAQLIRYRAQVKLLNYYILIARRIAIQRQRKRKEDLTLHTTEEGESVTIPIADAAGPTPDEDAAEREMAQRLGRAIANAFASLTEEQQFVLAMVYREQMLQKEAGAMVGWSEFKTSRQMSKATSQLREAMTSELGEAWTPSLNAAWEGCWQRAWESIASPGSAARSTVTQDAGA